MMDIRIIIPPEERLRRSVRQSHTQRHRELVRLRDLKASLEALCKDAPRELARVERRIERLERGDE